MPVAALASPCGRLGCRMQVAHPVPPHRFVGSPLQAAGATKKPAGSEVTLTSDFLVLGTRLEKRRTTGRRLQES